jgi:hypothetical protein
MVFALTHDRSHSTVVIVLVFSDGAVTTMNISTIVSYHGTAEKSKMRWWI